MISWFRLSLAINWLGQKPLLLLYYYGCKKFSMKIIRFVGEMWGWVARKTLNNQIHERVKGKIIKNKFFFPFIGMRFHSYQTLNFLI